MAKIEIEDRAFNDPDLCTAATDCRISKAVILGYAAIVWHRSQQLGLIEAPRKLILTWLDCDRRSTPEKAFKWLVAAKLLRPTNRHLDDSEIFFVAGNQTAVPRARKRIADALKAANIRHHGESSCAPHANGNAGRNAGRIADALPTYTHTANVASPFAETTPFGSEIFHPEKEKEKNIPPLPAKPGTKATTHPKATELSAAQAREGGSKDLLDTDHLNLKLANARASSIVGRLNKALVNGVASDKEARNKVGADGWNILMRRFDNLDHIRGWVRKRTEVEGFAAGYVIDQIRQFIIGELIGDPDSVPDSQIPNPGRVDAS